MVKKKYFFRFIYIFFASNLKNYTYKMITKTLISKREGEFRKVDEVKNFIQQSSYNDQKQKLSEKFLKRCKENVIRQNENNLNTLIKNGKIFDLYLLN